MPVEIITLAELNAKTKISVTSLRIYLSHYKLTKFQCGRGLYRFDDEFVTEFVKYLLKKDRVDEAERLERYWRKHQEYMKRRDNS